ncbi:MAG: recombinase family protein [Deltaproteobacteria bacterium]|nr:recombinase family protein [Deltaproteobacteria bacterium]
MKTAAAYVSDIILGRTGDVIGRESQKELIKQYAAENGIDIVAWFEDDLYNEDVLSRPGVQELLANRDQYQLVLVERVWALSRLWSVCERFFEELERADLRLESATTMWDCVSQMARRRFDKTLKTPKLRPARDVVTRRDAEPVRIKRPARLHLVFEQPAAAR